MKNFFSCVGLIIILAGSFSCSKKEDSSAAGGLNPADGSTVLAAAISGVQSASLVEGNKRMLNKMLFAPGTQSTNDPLCSTNAEPWDAEASDVMISGDGYIPLLFHCTVNGNLPESADNVTGSLSLLNSVICMMTTHFNATEATFTEEGNDFASEAQQNVATNVATCWPEGFPQGKNFEDPTELPFDKVEFKKLAANSGYEYQLHVESIANDIEYVARWFVKDGVLGFSAYEPPTGVDGTGGHTAIVLDSNNGVLLMNEIDDRHQDGDSYRDLKRLRVKGSMSSSFAFSSIDDAKGFIGVSGPSFQPNNGTDFVYSMYTVNSGSGLFSFKRFSRILNTLPTEADAECGDGDDCSAITDIGTVTEMDNLMRRVSGPYKDAWEAYMDTGLPMCDGGINSIDYTAVPASTGAFGVCASK